MSTSTPKDVTDLFRAMHAENLVADDLPGVFLRWDESLYGWGYHKLFENLMRINQSVDNKAVVSILQSTDVALHRFVGPTAIRIAQMDGRLGGEKARIDEVVSILNAYASDRNLFGLSQYAPAVAQGTFEYLDFLRSPNTAYFADSITNSAKANAKLVKAVLCQDPSVTAGNHNAMLSYLRASVERHGGVAEWTRKTVPPAQRGDLLAFTQWPEVAETLKRRPRSKEAEDLSI